MTVQRSNMFLSVSGIDWCWRGWKLLENTTFPCALHKVNVHQHTLHKISHKNIHFILKFTFWVMLKWIKTHMHISHISINWLTSFSKKKRKKTCFMMLITLKCIFDKQFIIFITYIKILVWHHTVSTLFTCMESDYLTVIIYICVHYRLLKVSILNYIQVISCISLSAIKTR